MQTDEHWDEQVQNSSTAMLWTSAVLFTLFFIGFLAMLIVFRNDVTTVWRAALVGLTFLYACLRARRICPHIVRELIYRHRAEPEPVPQRAPVARVV
jgi:hypothetical protein